MSISVFERYTHQVPEKFDGFLEKFLEHDHKLLKTFTSNTIDGLVALLHASSKHERLTSIYELLMKDGHLLRHFQSHRLEPKQKQILGRIIELFGVPVPEIAQVCFALEHSFPPISGKVTLYERKCCLKCDAVRLQAPPTRTTESLFLDSERFETLRSHYFFIFGTDHHVFRYTWYISLQKSNSLI